MPDYKESSVSGTSWQRCWGVYIQNLLESTPTIQLREEVITQIGEKRIHADAGHLEFAFDPGASIALRNPATGELTGQSVSQGELYVALWSLYMQKAAERDAAQVAP